MSDRPTMTMGVEGHDQDTHVERINPGDNPAAAPAQPEAPQLRGHPGWKKPYRLMAKAVHDGMLKAAGSLVWLYDHEVGAHHEPIPAPMPQVDEPPVDAPKPSPGGFDEEE